MMPREPDTRRHAKLERTLAEYSQDYGTSERTLKYWIRLGKQMRNPAPLDSPAAMAAWYRRCFDRAVPDRLLALETPAIEPTEPRNFSDVKGLDIEANVEALRRTHAINKQLLDEALAGTVESLTALRHKNFERSFNLLRLAEVSLTDLQKQRGNLIDKESVRSELAQKLATLRLMRERMASRIVLEVQKRASTRLERILRLLQNFLEPAVEKIRKNEEDVFRNLQVLDSPSAVGQKMDLLLERE